MCDRCVRGLGGGSNAYSGGGVTRGVTSDGSDRAFDEEDDPEPEDDLDFFRLSAGLTIAICGGFEESCMTTWANMGPRILV